MDAVSKSQNPDVRAGRFAKRCDGHHASFIRSVAPALLLILCSFIRHSYVTWQDDPCTTATITVHGVETPRTLTLKCNDQAYTAVGKEIAFRRVYHFFIENLEPGKEYAYSVEDCSHTFTTLNRHPPYRFVEGGDFENTDEADQLSALAATYKPDAVLLGGDYPSNVLSSHSLCCV